MSYTAIPNRTIPATFLRDGDGAILVDDDGAALLLEPAFSDPAPLTFAGGDDAWMKPGLLTDRGADGSEGLADSLLVDPAAQVDDDTPVDFAGLKPGLLKPDGSLKAGLSVDGTRSGMKPGGRRWRDA